MPTTAGSATDPGSDRLGSAATMRGDAMSSERRTPGPAGGELADDPTRVGRYLVLSRIGHGGMGVVLAAYDPELDRKVAIKLLLPERDRVEDQSRLLREAQAMAQLSHPNVVAVHDAGTFEGRVFLTMDFVEGESLRDRLRSRGHGRSEILAMFRQAGQGLAAAHEVGLVHRDFKPDNVLVDRRGRVQVTDFGLARSVGNTSDAAQTPSPAAEPSVDSWRGTALTRTGSLVGTPAYMSPEQLSGAPADARSDQFSFAVSLYEALHGERPFAGSTLAEQIESVLGGRVRPAPRGIRVPTRLRRTLLRALAVAPADRFASMAQLLAELARDPARQRIRALWGVGLLGVLSAGGWFYAGAQVDPCAGSGEQIASIWNPDRAAQVQDALIGTGLPWAETTAESVVARLHAYADAWTASHEQACRASTRGEQSDDLLDRRMACLDARRRELAALVDVLAQADTRAAEKAAQAAGNLRGVDRCADAQALLADLPPPEDPEVFGAVERWRESLARAKAHYDTGTYAEGLAIAQELAAEPEPVPYLPVQAELLLQLGELEDRTGDAAAAEEHLTRAFDLSLESGHETVAAGAGASAAYVVGYARARHAEGLRWGQHALALARHADPGGPTEAAVRNAVGIVRYAQGDYAGALLDHQAALAIRERTLGADHATVAASSTNAGLVAEAQGNYAEAEALHTRALGIFESNFGADHPMVASALSNRGGARLSQGRVADARTDHERALAIRLASKIPESYDLLVVYGNLGNVAKREGDAALARDYFLRSLDIGERVLGPVHPVIGVALNNLAETQESMGDHAAAVETHRRALAVREQALGPDHPDVARSLVGLSAAEGRVGRHEAERAGFERAVRIYETAFGTDHPELVPALVGLARSLQASGQDRDALAVLERALSVCEAREVPPDLVAETRLVLASALWDAGTDRARARALGEQAREAMASVSVDTSGLGRAIEAWLAAH